MHYGLVHELRFTTTTFKYKIYGFLRNTYPCMIVSWWPLLITLSNLDAINVLLQELLAGFHTVGRRISPHFIQWGGGYLPVSYSGEGDISPFHTVGEDDVSPKPWVSHPLISGHIYINMQQHLSYKSSGAPETTRSNLSLNVFPLPKSCMKETLLGTCDMCNK